MIDYKINRELEIGTEIIFYSGGVSTLIDGTIKEREILDNGDVSFLIETKNGKFLKVKHKNLDLYFVKNIY